MFFEFCYGVGVIVVALCLIILFGFFLTYLVTYRIGKRTEESIKEVEEIAEYNKTAEQLGAEQILLDDENSLSAEEKTLRKEKSNIKH